MSDATNNVLDDITLPTYTNGIQNKSTQQILDSNTTKMLGAQGRWTRVYADRIVYVDKVLAAVTSTTPPVDSAGHPIGNPTTTVTVYGNTGMEGADQRDARRTLTQPTSGAGYTVEGIYSGVLMGNALTYTGTPATNMNKVASGTTPNADYRVLNAATPSSSTVTIFSIDRGANQEIIGFTDTNGVKYLYDITYPHQLLRKR